MPMLLMLLSGRTGKILALALSMRWMHTIAMVHHGGSKRSH